MLQVEEGGGITGRREVLEEWVSRLPLSLCWDGQGLGYGVFDGVGWSREVIV